jgi:hypothetical protein
MIETEQRLQRASELLAERERHRVDKKDRAAALARAEGRGLVLSGEQRAVLRIEWQQDATRQLPPAEPARRSGPMPIMAMFMRRRRGSRRRAS